MLSRRTFIAGSTVTALYLGFGPALAAPTRPMLRRRDFEALDDPTFQVRDGSGRTFQCTLESVREGPVARGLDQFTLVFQRGERARLPGGLYELWHEELHRFPLRLDPSGGGEAGTFVAVFSQLT